MSFFSGFFRPTFPDPEGECPGFHMEGEEPTPCSGKRGQELSSWAPGAIPGETNRVVTLVHGTFAPHAEWMRDGGRLCEELGKLPNTRLSRFCWSGANTHTARLQAGKDLAIHLRCLIKEFPNAKHFVAGHSHGGNVILYAMKDKKPGDHDVLGKQVQVAGVITLATPFIALRERALPEIVRTSVWFTLIFAVVVIIYASFNEVPKASNVGLLAALFALWLVATAISARIYRARVSIHEALSTLS